MPEKVKIDLSDLVDRTSTDDLVSKSLGSDQVSSGIGVPSSEYARMAYSLDLDQVQEWMNQFAKSELFAKSIGFSPTNMSFATMNTQPGESFSGVLAWPEPSPMQIRPIVDKNLAAQMVIGLRVTDVLQYSRYSSHFWRPGWRIELKDGSKHPSGREKRDIQDAIFFLQNSNKEFSDNEKMVEHRLRTFPQFLAAIVRNSLTFDGIAINLDRTIGGEIQAFWAFDASTVRLVNPVLGYSGTVTPQNYLVGYGTPGPDQTYPPEQFTNDKSIFAVQMSEAMKVVRAFKRDELIWYVRNPRLDDEIYFYGLAESVVAGRMIENFTNAMEMNQDLFNKNSIPQGFLVMSGTGWTQKQLDFLARLWSNMKRGKGKDWGLPVVKSPPDGELSLLDLSRLKDSDVYYKSYINMVMGALCTSFKIPLHRLGYFASGKDRDNVDKEDTAPTWVDEEDRGKIVLLYQLEEVVNLLIQKNWPHLEFRFTGVSPKEDAREYQQKMNAMTFDERRAMVDLPSLLDLVKKETDGDANDEDLHELAKLMSLAPIDSSQTGIYQNLVSTYLKVKYGVKDTGSPDRGFDETKDPVDAARHGQTPGVRRGHGN